MYVNKTAGTGFPRENRNLNAGDNLISLVGVII